MFTPVWLQWPQYFRGYPRWLYRRERILAIRRRIRGRSALEQLPHSGHVGVAVLDDYLNGGSARPPDERRIAE